MIPLHLAPPSRPCSPPGVAAAPAVAQTRRRRHLRDRRSRPGRLGDPAPDPRGGPNGVVRPLHHRGARCDRLARGAFPQRRGLLGLRPIPGLAGPHHLGGRVCTAACTRTGRKPATRELLRGRRAGRGSPEFATGAPSHSPGDPALFRLRTARRSSPREPRRPRHQPIGGPRRAIGLRGNRARGVAASWDNPPAPARHTVA